jgi:membrane-bound ClpP family serine protease
VCFLLFFWSRYLGGTAGWLEGMLFLAGIAFLLMEIFVLPGFGVFGLGGGALVLISLILASQTFVLPHNAYQFAQLQRSLLVLAGAAVGIVAVAVSLRRWLPHTPFFSQMFLPPPNDEEAEVIKRRESLVGFDDSLVGRRGVTTTQLTPSGKARFGDEFIDVIADGELIEPGTEIVVVEVHGYRVVVESAPKETS